MRDNLWLTLAIANMSCNFRKLHLVKVIDGGSLLMVEDWGFACLFGLGCDLGTCNGLFSGDVVKAISFGHFTCPC